MKSDKIWMNGTLVPFEDAKVHVLAPGLHYGLGVFEGIRCYNTPLGPAVFRLREHMERFEDSALAFGLLEMPYSVDEMVNAVKETVRANGFKSCYIRPLLFMEGGPLSLNLDAHTPGVSISAWEWASLLGDEGVQNGVRLMVSSFTRLHPNVNLTKAKVSGNYVNSVMAKTIAVRLGFDEAVMLDPSGLVAECTGENLFLVRKGKIYTPSTAAILEGITRDSLITLAKDAGYEVVEGPISRDQIYIADEVFVCGTAAEVVPVTEVDFRKIGNGKIGPVTSVLQKAFNAVIRGEGPRAAEWLDPIE
ncbi:MAG: branched chain amino acid aminotransferase [Anaerolineaceae bacterium]|nr:branched chain amino acid aminotransferase [Anaerolineaceae bacterium]